MKNLEKYTQHFKLLVNSSHGVYMAQNLLNNWVINGVDEHIIDEILKNNPYNYEYYWDLVTDLYDNATININDKNHYIIQNEDLWAIPIDLEIPEDLWDEWII